MRLHVIGKPPRPDQPLAPRAHERPLQAPCAARTALISPTRQRVQRLEKRVGSGSSPRAVRLQIVVVDVPKTSAKVLSSQYPESGKSSNLTRCATLLSLVESTAPEWGRMRGILGRSRAPNYVGRVLSSPHLLSLVRRPRLGGFRLAPVVDFPNGHRRHLSATLSCHPLHACDHVEGGCGRRGTCWLG